MKVQFDKSQYSTVGRSSCLVPIKNSEPVSYVCLECVCVCLCVCVCVGGGVWLGVTTGNVALLYVKSHEL